MNYRDAIVEDIKQIECLLSSYALPVNDIEENLHNFFVAEQDKEIAGVCGFEHYSEIALLRSMAVAEKYRENAIGKALFELFKKRIYKLKIKEVYLLTENASDYFKKIGFVEQSRQALPETILQTKQFKSICPTSAIVMRYQSRLIYA